MARSAGKKADGWETASIKLVDAQHGLYSDIPMLCMGKAVSGGCEYSKFCPYSEEEVNERFIGINCPVEVVEAFKLFAGYIVDLDIKPSDFTDIQTVVDIVRLHLQIRRCDLYMKSRPIWQENVAGVVQSSGKAKYNKVVGVGHTMSRELRGDLDRKYQQLVATRESKVKAEVATGNAQKDMATVMANIYAAAAKVNKNKEDKVKKLKDTSTVDAEFEVSSDED